ncbi:phage tail sheath C-terminal domain-containing protein, partial [Ramlibacter sp.]|uniref:phage tail sheath family protein n=1 Tax=Ramlibacter sp. TaxID=1917967 RepID=UPI0017FF1946
PAPAAATPAAAPAAGAPAPAAAEAAPLAGRDLAALNVGGEKYLLAQAAGFYLLYNSMLHFFQNGGGPCYIVSVGSYAADPGFSIDGSRFETALEELTKELEPTMIVMPEAILLKSKDCYALQQQAILHCGTVMKNRVAILDVWEGYRERNDTPDVVAQFRDKIGTNTLGFASAYYPWVNTTIVQERDLSYINIASAADGLDVLTTALTQEAAAAVLGDNTSKYGPGVTRSGDIPREDKAAVDRYDALVAEINKISTETDPTKMGLLAKTLATISPFYNAVIGEMAKRLNVLPPSPAMAGVYTMVDNARGVWKAPANVSLNSVVSPTVPISSEQQEDLNVTPQGKSINAIRAFRGEGTLVWGGRTLDGNSLDWRYVNVRRTMIMLEESIRLAAKAMVFEPNVANTWVTMKSMVNNFLTSVWKRGGLAGAVPEDAFSVHVGLGETMTPDDILEGIMRVSVLVAISRPAEFIEITFQQQMQKS